MSVEVAVTLAQAQALAINASGLLGGATLTIYSGARPANTRVAVTSQVALVALALPAASANVVANGRISFGAIANATAIGSGTAAWARITNGGSTLADLDVGLAAANPDIVLDTLAVVAGDTVVVSSASWQVVATTMDFSLAGNGAAECTFAPVLTLGAGATVLWEFSDGTTSTLPTPSKTYTGKLTASLTVSDWSLLTGINLGYDASDGGSSSIALVANQHVDGIVNLSFAQSSLDTFCASYNPMTSLDFSNFANLATIEMYHSFLTSLTLTGCAALKRLSLETSALTELDISDSPLIENVCAGNQSIATLTFASTVDHLNHLCIGHDPMSSNLPYSKFTAMEELLVPLTQQTGAVALSSQHLGLVWLYTNDITSLDLSAAKFPTAAYAYLSVHDCPSLSSITLGSCGAKELDLSNNALTKSALASILSDLDGSGVTGGTVDVSGEDTALLNTAAQASKAALVAKGWTITDNGNAVAPDAPADLAAGTVTTSSIPLSWSAVSGAGGYRLYRALTSGGELTMIYEGANLYYVDTGRAADTSYYYKVSAYVDDMESDASAEVQGTTESESIDAPATPTGLTVGTETSTTIPLTWNTATGATGYRVYRSATSEGTYAQVYEGSDAHYTDSALSSETAYYYKVTAYNSGGESAQSSSVTGTTEAAGVGVVEDFEDASLQAGITKTDTASLITIPSTNYHFDGASSMEVDLKSASEAYLEWDFDAIDSVVFSCIYRTGSGFAAWGGDASVAIAVKDTYGGNRIRIIDRKNNSTNVRELRFAENDYSWPVSDSTPYNIMVKFVKSGVCRVRVYDLEGTLIGAESTFTDTGGYQTSAVAIGKIYSELVTNGGKAYFDHAVLDVTAGTWPLMLV